MTHYFFTADILAGILQPPFYHGRLAPRYGRIVFSGHPKSGGISPIIRGIEWSHPIWKCSQNLAFARIARKNKMWAHLLVLAKVLQELACSDFR